MFSGLHLHQLPHPPLQRLHLLEYAAYMYHESICITESSFINRNEMSLIVWILFGKSNKLLNMYLFTLN